MPEKKTPHGTILSFSGPETFLLNEHVQKYFSAAEQKYGEFNVSKIDPEETDFQTLKSELLSPPFFGNGKRVFFLQSFPFKSSGKMSEDKKLKQQHIIETLKSIPQEVVVICICQSPDKRTKAWKDLLKIADKDNSQSFSQLTEDNLTQWILKRATQRNAHISSSEAQYLWQYAGSNLWTLSHEIEKLVAYAGSNPISQQDIEHVCNPSFETIQFALSNAFSSGKESQVHTVFHRMIEGGESPLTILFRDFGSIMRQFLLVRYALDNNSSAKEVGIHPFVFGKIRGIVSRFSLQHLTHMHAKLVEIDQATKTGGIQVSTGKEGMLIFALERWIGEFFENGKKNSVQ